MKMPKWLERLGRYRGPVPAPDEKRLEEFDRQTQEQRARVAALMAQASVMSRTRFPHREAG